MAVSLQVENPIDEQGQTVLDENGTRTSLILSSTGNIGIGIPNPQRALHIHGGVCFDLLDGTLPEGLFGWQIAAQGNVLTFHENTKPNKNGRHRMVIVQGGNVGINTFTPTERLEVNGNVLAANVIATGDVQLTGADCAEDFDVDVDEAIEAGMVMVIGDDERLHSCDEAYDRRVAGVLSGAGDCRPGVILGKRASADKRLPLALNGKVFCRVDAGFAPVDVGDLLTTSPTRGHAMKAIDPGRAFGAVLGKALRPLKEGCGLIPVLVALQ